MTESEIPKSLHQHVLEPLGLRSIRSVAPGMSGARVFRCLLSAGDEVALKRWPAGTAPARIEEIHQVLRTSRQNGCVEVPELYELAAGADRCRTLWTDRSGGLWDLTRWMPGDPIEADATLDQIQAGAAAIARFHGSVRSIGVGQQQSPAVSSRLERFRQLDATLKEKTDSFRPSESMPAEIRDASQLIQWRWGSARDQIEQSLNRYVGREVPVHYVLRDVHREHVLYCDGQVSGLIDFDAIRIDSPEADLARWVGSFLVDRAEVDRVWDAGLAGFRDENALISGWEGEIDPMMAKDLCFATTWISLVNWLVWILLEKRTFPAGPQAVLARLRELTRLASQGT